MQTHPISGSRPGVALVFVLWKSLTQVHELLANHLLLMCADAANEQTADRCGIHLTGGPSELPAAGRIQDGGGAEDQRGEGATAQDTGGDGEGETEEVGRGGGQERGGTAQATVRLAESFVCQILPNYERLLYYLLFYLACYVLTMTMILFTFCPIKTDHLLEL